jgi:hypothetical protein
MSERFVGHYLTTTKLPLSLSNAGWAKAATNKKERTIASVSKVSSDGHLFGLLDSSPLQTICR